MISIEQLKQTLTPIIVAQHYLGQPKKQGSRLWYKSPFRNERTASLMVDEISFHDFGDSWDGDVIDFIERYYNVDFITAIKILTKDFGLPDTYTTKEMEEYLKREREEQQEAKIKLDKWFYDTFTKLCNELMILNKEIKHLKSDALVVAYNKQIKIEYWLDIFIEATEEGKLKLWRVRNEIHI